MSFSGGYISDINLNNLTVVGDIPLDHNVGGYGQTTGLNNYILVLNPAISQYRPGMVLAVRFSQSNSGLGFLNVNGLGTKPLKKIVSGVLIDLAIGELAISKIYLAVYDGSVFQITNTEQSGQGTIVAASETTAGIVQFASVVNPGINDKAISPDKLIQYVADKVTGLWNNKGLLDCSTDPPYPVGKAGEAYTVSVGGKIGGITGQVVEVRDVIYCTADTPVGGGTIAHWNVLQANLVQATEITAGFSKVATQAELQAGTDDSHFITALKLRTFLLGIYRNRRHQIRFYSDSLNDNEITPTGMTTPNLGIINISGIPAGAIIHQATLIWEGAFRNTNTLENTFSDGFLSISNGGPFVNHLGLSAVIRLGGNQVNTLRLVEEDVRGVVQGNGSYLAVCADIKTAYSSIFMSGFWTIEVDYEIQLVI